MAEFNKLSKGFKKSFKKSNQFMCEKIGLSKSTGYDQKYYSLEKKIDVYCKLVDESREKTHEMLQPNPVIRTKLTTVNNWAKLRGDEKISPYPQAEDQLGDIMIKHSGGLGDKSVFGNALFDLGESLKQMGAYKQLFEYNIKQNFIDPLTHLKHDELKSIMHARKNCESLRLDFDSQRNTKKYTPNNERDITRAGQKFEQSKIVTETEMIKFLNNENDQITLLQNFVAGMMDYHKRCEELLKTTMQDLNSRQKNLKNMGNRDKGDFLSAKTMNIKNQIKDLVRHEERDEPTEL